MPRIRQIKELFNRQLPSYEEGNLILRGLSFPIDDFLKGDARFAKKLGAFLPIFVPDNSFALSEDTVAQVDTITVDQILSSLDVDMLLQIGGRELVQVEDFDSTNLTISLTTLLQASYIAGTEVRLFAVPIEVIGAYGPGATTITVQSAWKLFPGDKLVIHRAELLEAFDIVAINATTLLSTVGDEYVFSLDLDNSLRTSLTDGEQIFFRAFPAYESTNLLIPEYPLGGSVGPFLVDYISGALVDKAYPLNETLTITLLGNAGTVLNGPTVVDKNTLITGMPIRNDSILFWDVVEGRLNYDGSANRVMMICNELGQCTMATPLVPVMEPNSIWRVTLQADTDANAHIRFGDNPAIAFSLLAGVPLSADVGILAGGEDAEIITIAVKGEPTLPSTGWFDVITAITPGTTISINHYELTAVSGLRTIGQNDFSADSTNFEVLADEIADAINDPSNVFAVMVQATTDNARINLESIDRSIRANDIKISTNASGELDQSGGALTGGQDATILRISDFTLNGVRIQQIRYSIVAEVGGVYTWASSGLLIKPMFVSLDLLKGNFDFSTLNDGIIHL